MATGKIVEVVFEKAIETYEHQMQMLDMVDVYKPDSATMQNGNNFIWRPVQQHAPVIEGWDMTGQETGIIEETYPAVLGLPKNDIYKQRADDLRDMGFWERRGEQSGKKQATFLNQNLAQLVADTGSIFYRTNATSGYDAIAEGESILNERQSADDMRYMTLNTRDNQFYAQDLAGRQTLQGRPESAWKRSQIGENVAEFDVYTGSFLPNLTGGADPATTVTGDQSFKPEGGSVSATGVVTNVDYREATIPVAASGSYNVGDKIQFENGGTPVESVGLADKNATGQPMTFTIAAIPDGTSITVFPKPIALDDPGLNVLEKAYANVNTQILNTATVNRLNIDASAKVNAFWCKDSIEVIGGDAPLQLFKDFAGQKMISSTMSNGQVMYMVYDGDILTMDFTCRLFTWYGLTNKNPSANGVFVRY